MLHWTTKHLIEWYFDDQGPEGVADVIAQQFAGRLKAKTEKAYSGEDYIADVQILGADGSEVNVEVIVTSGLGKRKGLDLLEHPSQVIILNLKGVVDQAYLQPRLLEWHDLTWKERKGRGALVVDRAEALATDIIEYLFLGDMIKELAA
jgi:hypothetical protein